jgi:hypothetical protein
MSCNRGNFLVSILILTFALTLGCSNSAFSQTANEYFELGKADLANNSLAAAHTDFQHALSLNPNHEGANFFYALTSILMIPGSSQFNRLLDRAGVSASGRNIFDWNADFARDAYGNIILPADTPTGGDLRAFAQSNLLPVIVQAINSLGKVGSSFVTNYNWAFETGTGAPSGLNTFTTYTNYWSTNEWVGYRLVIYGSEYDIISNTGNVLTLSRNLSVPSGNSEYKIVAPVEIDFGDALVIRGGLNLAKAAVLIFSAYDFNVDIDALVPLIDTPGFDIQTHVIQAYPQLLTLLPTNQMGEAKASVRESITQLSRAVDSIVGEGDPQGNDLLILNPADGAEFSMVLEEWKNALDGPVFIKELNTQVDLAQFFDHPKNLRDYLPAFSGTLIIRGSFPDPTFGGIFPAMSATELYRLLGTQVRDAVVQVSLTAPPSGAVSAETLGPAGDLVAGYSTVTVRSGSVPYGTAVFSVTRNGNVVSEVGVPASPPTRSARFFVDSRSSVSPVPGSGPVTISTGFAAVNPNQVGATLGLKLREGGGATLAQGSIRLARGEHVAKFLDQLAPDFVLPAGFVNNGLATLEITSDQPVSVLALRLTINQRNDLLLTSTPIADLGKAVPSGPVAFPQVVDGGGYQTTLILMNTSGEAQKGVVSFYGNSGTPLSVRMVSAGAADSRVSYSIQPAGYLRFVTDGSPAATNVGWAQLVPDNGHTAPVCAAVFGFTQGGILVTETGVPGVTGTTHARIYVDKSGGHDTGLAIANPGSSAIKVTATAYHLDGKTSAGAGPGTVNLVSLGHDARFAGQLISGLPSGFIGVLDLVSASPFTALTLRSLTNGRGDFLITTFPIADANQSPPAPVIFPQIANGGGYQTQIILLSTSGSTSTLTVGYFGNDGAPIPVGR